MGNDCLKMLVSLDVRHTASRRMIGGIMRFAATHPAWEVQFAQMHPSDQSLADFADWRPDALIADGPCRTLPHEMRTHLARAAAVYVNTPPPPPPPSGGSRERPSQRFVPTSVRLRRPPPSFSCGGSPRPSPLSARAVTKDGARRANGSSAPT